MADARTMVLPLVGGGDHDWNTILRRWGLLQYDTRLASALIVAAWIGMISACCWVLWRARQDRKELFSTQAGLTIASTLEPLW